MYYVGIDLGGTNIAAGIVDENGKIVKKGSVPTGRERSAEAIIADMAALVEKLLNELNLKESDIHSIGIGSPGSLDREKGVIIYANNLNFRHVPVRELIQRKFNLPVYVENDANCAAIAESVAGAAKDASDSIVITIGTGIGGGIIVGRKLYTGFNGAGAELGHMVVQIGGEACTCGRKGCWEAYSSATALIEMTKKAAKAHPDSKIVSLVGGDLSKVDAKTAFDAARLEDETGKAVIDNYLDILAEALANMINIFQPQVLAIGGGVSKEGENLLGPLRRKMEGLTYCADGVPQTSLVAAKMGNDAGIIGAAFITKA